MTVTVITPPTVLVSPADAKAWAPVLAGDSVDRLTMLLGVAQAGIEPPQGWIGRACGVQTLEVHLGACGVTDLVPLPCPPLRSVVSVICRDAKGVDHTLDPSAYRVVSIGGARSGLLFRSGAPWPSTACDAGAVRIRFEAGYAADDPQLLPVKQAIVLAATDLRSLTSRDLALSSRTVEGTGSRTWIVSDAAQKLIETVKGGPILGRRGGVKPGHGLRTA